MLTPLISKEVNIMKINKSEFEKYLADFDKAFQKIITRAAEKVDKCLYDFNSGDKSVTLIAITPTESVELTTRQGLDVLRVTAYTATSEDGVDRDIMRDKPQITASIPVSGEVTINLFEGADEEVVKRLTEKVKEFSKEE
jgi:hypothetical protein